MKKSIEEMNDIQLNNWKKLVGSSVSKSQIEGLRDFLQNRVNELGEDIKKRNNCNGKCSMCKKEDECDLDV